MRILNRKCSVKLWKVSWQTSAHTLVAYREQRLHPFYSFQLACLLKLICIKRGESAGEAWCVQLCHPLFNGSHCTWFNYWTCMLKCLWEKNPDKINFHVIFNMRQRGFLKKNLICQIKSDVVTAVCFLGGFFNMCMIFRASYSGYLKILLLIVAVV